MRRQLTRILTALCLAAVVGVIVNPVGGSPAYAQEPAPAVREQAAEIVPFTGVDADGNLRMPTPDELAEIGSDFVKRLGPDAKIAVNRGDGWGPVDLITGKQVFITDSYCSGRALTACGNVGGNNNIMWFDYTGPGQSMYGECTCNWTCNNGSSVYGLTDHSCIPMVDASGLGLSSCVAKRTN